MNQMEIFKNPEFGSIRVIEENGKYLFSGTDVAAALGYSNSRDAIIRHCRYVVKRDAPHPQSPDRKISMTFIPEGDLYRGASICLFPSLDPYGTFRSTPGMVADGFAWIGISQRCCHICTAK